MSIFFIIIINIIVTAVTCLFILIFKETIAHRKKHHLEYSGNIESDKAHFEVMKLEGDEYKLIQVTEDGNYDNDITITTNKEQLEDLKHLLNKVII